MAQQTKKGFMISNWEWSEINFHGRINRRPYIQNMLILCAVSFVSYLLVFLIIGIIPYIYVCICSFGLTTRRLHDIGKSGWWQLVFFIPLIGSILFFLWVCQDSDPFENRYGENPKPEDMRKQGITPCSMCGGRGKLTLAQVCTQCGGQGFVPAFANVMQQQDQLVQPSQQPQPQQSPQQPIEVPVPPLSRSNR